LSGSEIAALRKLQNFINGEYTDAKAGETLDIINPATGLINTSPVKTATV
jgi:acyl-CoA reductase-like NAD-dependent aldehyde dehydrogenase